jgi:hypothetical protein
MTEKRQSAVIIRTGGTQLCTLMRVRWLQSKSLDSKVHTGREVQTEQTQSSSPFIRVTSRMREVI